MKEYGAENAGLRKSCLDTVSLKFSLIAAIPKLLPHLSGRAQYKSVFNEADSQRTVVDDTVRLSEIECCEDVLPCI